MSRRKARKPRRSRPERPGDVYLQFDTAENVRVRLPGFTAVEYAAVRELAQAGNIHDPLVMKLVRAFGAVIGYDVDAHADEWADTDTIQFLRWLEFVPEDVWTGLDDVELATVEGGAS
ncbi:hypothetical protein ABZ235_33915 [Streptomyces canus]|uniref:hypothetical protein n=1 Tax=Streptomyces canus TaxID=58343 RepID=UPI0033B35496